MWLLWGGLVLAGSVAEEQRGRKPLCAPPTTTKSVSRNFVEDADIIDEEGVAGPGGLERLLHGLVVGVAIALDLGGDEDELRNARDAALCDGELVSLDASEGRICGQMVVPYPPGIPVLLPGLRITRPMIDLLLDVVATEGAGAVHGLFVRGKALMVEVLDRAEEGRVQRVAPL